MYPSPFIFVIVPTRPYPLSILPTPPLYAITSSVICHLTPQVRLPWLLWFSFPLHVAIIFGRVCACFRCYAAFTLSFFTVPFLPHMETNSNSYSEFLWNRGIYILFIVFWKTFSNVSVPTGKLVKEFEIRHCVLFDHLSNIGFWKPVLESRNEVIKHQVLKHGIEHCYNLTGSSSTWYPLLVA